MLKLRMPAIYGIRTGILCVSLFLFIGASALAEQRVAGAISTNTTWSAEKGPYILLGEVIVNENVTLKIMPGTLVKFEGYSALNVKGRLWAYGSADKYIHFTTTNSNPGPSNWQFIRIGNSKSRSVVRYARIEYAGNGILCEDASPVILDSVIQHSAFGVVVTGASRPIIRRCAISDTGIGVRAIGTAGGGPAPIVNYCTFYSNTWHDFQAADYTNGDKIEINLRYNYWGGDTLDEVIGSVVGRHNNPSLPQLDISYFLNKEGKIIGQRYIWGHLMRNTIWNASAGTYYVIGDFTVPKGITLSIKKGVEIRFIHHFFFQVDGTLKVEGEAGFPVKFTTDRPDPVFSSWQFIKFTSASKDSIIDYAVIEYAGQGIYCQGASPIIRNSVIQNNFFGIKIEEGSHPAITGNKILANAIAIDILGPGSGGSPQRNPNPVIRWNSFANNLYANIVAKEFASVSPETTTIDARYNWWGTTDAARIAFFHDYYHDVPEGQKFNYDSPVILFQPFLAQEGNIGYPPDLPLEFLITPDGGSTFLSGAKVDIKINVQDPDSGSLQYQFLIGGEIKQPWSNSNFYSWQTTASDTGYVDVTCEARGSNNITFSQTLTYQIINPTVQEILQQVASNYARIQDFKADMTLSSTLNGQTFGETDYCRYYFKAPNKEKTETYSDSSRTAKTDIIIISGSEMHLINPVENIKQTVDLLADAEISSGQFNQMDIYYNPYLFLNSHRVARNDSNSDLDNNIIALDAVPNQQNNIYDKLGISIDYQKGIITGFSIYKNNELNQSELVQETNVVESQQLPNGAYLPVKMTKIPNLSEGTLVSALSYENLQINTGLGNSDFDPSQQ